MPEQILIDRAALQFTPHFKAGWSHDSAWRWQWLRRDEDANCPGIRLIVFDVQVLGAYVFLDFRNY